MVLDAKQKISKNKIIEKIMQNPYIGDPKISDPK